MLKAHLLQTLIKGNNRLSLNLVLRRVSTETKSNELPLIKVQDNNGVRKIILSDKKTRNSLTWQLMDSLQYNLEQDKDNSKLRCIVLSADGPAWCSGHNLKELKVGSDEDRQLAFKKLVNIIKSIREHPVPVIAEVNGVAAAAGVQLMASCDLVLSTKHSRFSTPGARFGIFCSTPGIALARTIAPLHASYMLFTGAELNAEEAYNSGLISRLADDEKHLAQELQNVTEQICAKSRSVVALGKSFFYEQLDLDFEEAYDRGVKKMVENLEMHDGKEGVNSFIEKRKPNWRHK